MQKYVECISNNKVLRGMQHIPEHKNKVPAVIAFHGFSSDRCETRAMFVDLSRKLEVQGIASFRFDFAGSGESDGKFSDMTISTEISDAVAIFEYVAAQDFVDQNNIFLLGMSLGGVVAALTAARLSNAFKAAVLWAPAFIVADACKDGCIINLKFDSNNVPDVIDFYGLELGKGFVEDAIKLDLYGESSSIKIPVMILHGSIDEIVPIKYSEQLHRMIESSEFIIVQDAGHSFDTIGHRTTFIDESIGFIKSQCN